MLSIQLERASIKTGPAINLSPKEFNSHDWKLYFEKSREDHVRVNLPNKLDVAPELRLPLVRSLQRFQIGETGTGLHLKRFAESYGDPDYDRCVDLFIKEEQGHAQVLSQVILALDGKLQTWHWTDLAFKTLRRLLGLKTELFILFIAEVIGKTFYKMILDKSKDAYLEEVFALIVLDELMHLEFHAQFLSSQLKEHSGFVLASIHYMWCFLFYAACMIFVLDHKKGLEALGSSPADFLSESSKVFLKYSKRACLQ